MSERTRVLVVEDNPADVDLMREALPKTGPIQFHIESVPRLSEALARLVTGEIDVVLIDLGLPDSQGLATFQKLRQAAPDLAMVVLTGYDDMETAVAAVREGAQEYLVKGQFSRNLLVRTVRYAIERKKTESRERLARNVLDLLNRPDGTEGTIGDILQLIKKGMDFEAVGIRLQEGDDFPYYMADGFSEDFLRAERHLCAHNEAGEIVRDATGNPVLECMCGNILRGRTNPALPFFTEGGSFWSNNTSALLASTTEADRQARTRNRCNGEGYESVALIPLRSGGEIIGLLQLNDHRPDRFTLEMIGFFEGLGASIGIALARKRAEEALRKGEEFARRVIESSSDCIKVLDLGGHLLSMSAGGQKRLDIDDITPYLNASWVEFWKGKDREAALEAVSEARRGKTGMFSGYCETAKGTPKWWEILVSPIKDTRGNIDRLLAVSRDVTDRKRAEEALSASEVRYRRLFEAAKDGILILDAETGAVVDVNPFLLELLGYPREQILGAKIWELGFLKDIVTSKDNFRELQQRGYIRYEDLPLETVTGRQIAVEFVSNVYEVNHHKVIQCNIRDITERKQAADRIRHLNRVLRAVRDVNQLIVHEKDAQRLIQDACNLLVGQRGYGGALIILTDETGTPRTYAQAGLEKVFGPLAESLKRGGLPPCCEKARQHGQVYLVTDRAKVCAPCPIVAECVASNGMCMQLKHDEAAYGYLSVAMERALSLDEEELSLFTETAGDIAFALHTIEMERQRQRMEIERRELEARIHQQQRLESLGTLAGGVAHEINNPINGIMNYAQLIVDEQGEDSPSREFAAEIVRETERIALIVRNLLTFARHEKQSRSPARLKDIVDGVLSLIRTVIRHDQIAIEVHIPDDLPTLLCRTQQIQQVLMNLMTNARDALNARFPGHDADKVMMLEAHTFDKEGAAWMRITLEDHGIGISAEQREHLFDPFFTSKPKGIGTGLGLSISHGLVTEHGGQITFESEPNTYTRFFVDLPTDGA